MFNLYGIDKIAAWREFRDTLETSNTPLDDVAEFWSQAPFVNPFLDPSTPNAWPDPWKLVIDNRLDDLAITLGMLYTLKLTKRFELVPCEIYETTLPDDTDSHFCLAVNKQSILNLEYRNVVDFDVLKTAKTKLIWSK